MTVDRGRLTPPAELSTERLRLVPLGPEHFDGLWSGLHDPEAMRLTGTRTTFEEGPVREWLSSLAARDDRADWAILRADGSYAGEVVLNELDEDNDAMNFRIGLVPPWGRGVGTEATRAVVAYGFDVVGLHRITLGVFAFNPRAQRAYEKAGFVREGVDREAHRWDGEWHDEVRMAMLATDPRP